MSHAPTNLPRGAAHLYMGLLMLGLGAGLLLGGAPLWGALMLILATVMFSLGAPYLP